MLNKLGLLIVLVSVIFIASCAEHATLPPNQDPFRFTFLSSEAVVPDSMSETERYYLQLGVIPGAFYGSPLDDPFWYVDLADPNRTALFLDSFIGEIEKFILQNRHYERYEDLRVTPEKTRFARISTLGFDLETEEKFGSGFLEDGQAFMLVYFDRPCTVVGVAELEDGEIYIHDLQIPSAGFYRIYLEEGQELMRLHAGQSEKPIEVMFY